MQAMSLLKLTSTSSAGVEDDQEELAKKRSEATDLLFETMPSRVMEVLDAGKVLPCHHAQRASWRECAAREHSLPGLPPS